MNIDISLDPFEDFVPDYMGKVREFSNRTFEMVVRVIRPMQRDSAKERYEAFGDLALPKPKEELSESELEAIRAENWTRAVRRAKQRVRWLCNELAADRLLTLTYRENVQDRDRVKKDFTRFVRMVRKYEPEWGYVAILEKQDRGAYHVHCAVKGFQKIKVLRKLWYQALGGSGTEEGDQTPGQIDVTSPNARWGSRGREWKTNRLAAYISKYMHKTFDETATEKRRYWHAKDLKAPEPERFWIGASNIAEFVKSVHSRASFIYGDQIFDMWLSPDGELLYLSGQIK